MTVITKNRYIWGLLGFVAGVWVTNIGVVLTIRNSVVREYRSPQNLNATVQTIAGNAAQRGWKVSEPMAFERDTGGQEPTNVPVRVLQISNPYYTHTFVEHNRNRSVAVAPMTIVVYERDGQVYVSSVNNGLIGRFFRIEAKEPLNRIRSEEAQILEFLAKR